MSLSTPARVASTFAGVVLKRHTWMRILLCFAWMRNLATAASVPVPNHSFESPASSFVSINIDSWQKTPKPDWYVEGGGFLWTQLTGAFQNTANSSPDHIMNCDGNQLIWLFVVPEVGLFQDYNSLDLDDPSPTHAFDARFEVGKSYHLTVGIIGTGGGMQQGATLELSLYYRDVASNRVTVAATSVTNLITVFSNNTQLLDCTVNVPTVRATDAWANQSIGILLLSTVSTNLQGGYWDLDNVRLREGPAFLNPTKASTQFSASLLGEPGAAFEFLTTTNIALPSSAWTSLGIVTNINGTIPFIDTAPEFDQRFYRARQLP
jgi:hypothetical protein